MELEPLIELLRPYVFWPAVPVIVALTTVLAKIPIFDWGKLKWTMALILGVAFGVAQKLGAPLLSREPIQAEWIPAIIMGFSTGLLATGGYSAYKNWNQRRKAKKQ